MKRTLYARRDLINAEEFIHWAKGQGFKTTLPDGKLHVTIIYSRTTFEWGEDNLRPITSMLTCKGGERSLENFNDGAVVLRFFSSSLKQRNAELIAAGGKTDFPNYKSHITITYNGEGIDITKVKPFVKPLLLGPEVFKVIDPDWQRSLVEKMRLG